MGVRPLQEKGLLTEFDGSVLPSPITIPNQLPALTLGTANGVDVIYDAIDSVRSNVCFSRITSITFLDTDPPIGTVTYTLNAIIFCSFTPIGETITSVTTTAPTTFTAAEIEANP